MVKLKDLLEAIPNHQIVRIKSYGEKCDDLHFGSAQTALLGFPNCVLERKVFCVYALPSEEHITVEI